MEGESCHRVTVAKLVREFAQQRSVALQTVEWPGEEPAVMELEVPTGNPFEPSSDRLGR